MSTAGRGEAVNPDAFYDYRPPRPLEEIAADIQRVEKEIVAMLREMSGSCCAAAPQGRTVSSKTSTATRGCRSALCRALADVRYTLRDGAVVYP